MGDGDDSFSADTTTCDPRGAAPVAALAEGISSPFNSDGVAHFRGDALTATSAARDDGTIFVDVDGSFGRAAAVFDDDVSEILNGNGGLEWFLVNGDGDDGASKARS